MPEKNHKVLFKRFFSIALGERIKLFLTANRLISRNNASKATEKKQTEITPNIIVTIIAKISFKKTEFSNNCKKRVE